MDKSFSNNRLYESKNDNSLPAWRMHPVIANAENLREEENFEAEAWTGEGPQNTADSTLDFTRPAQLKISVKNLSGSVLRKYVGSLEPHHQACEKSDRLIYGSDFHGQDGQVLILEDFNTTGLLGPLNFREDEERYERNFLGLMRSSGDVVNKSKGKLGSRGQGKITFAAASRGRCWFAYSVRADHETPDPEKRVLMGRTTLRPHWVGSTQYSKDGHWGVWKPTGEGINSPFPCADESIIDEFVGDFGLTRKPDETGTSIVIPYFSDSGESEAVVLRLIERNYALIVQRRLEIQVNFESSGQSFDLTADRLLSVIQGFLESSSNSEWLEVLARVECLNKMMTALQDERTHFRLPEPNSRTSVERYIMRLPEETQQQLVEAYRLSGQLVIRIPVTVTEKTLEGKLIDHRGQLDLALFRDADVGGHWPEFLRDGLRIAPIRRTSMVRSRIGGMRTILSVSGRDSNGLQMLLRASETGAHEDWKSDTHKFKQSWESGKAWIDFVKKAPEGFSDFIKGKRDDLDLTGFSFLADPNPDDLVEGPNTSGTETSGSGRARRTPKPKPPRLPKETQPTIRGYKDAGRGCCEITLNGVKSSQIEVIAAYDTDEGSAFSKYDPADFEFGTMQSKGDLVVRGGEVREIGGNHLLVDVTDFETFAVEIKGFDIRRVPVVLATVPATSVDDEN